jgi:hypothetical protein
MPSIAAQSSAPTQALVVGAHLRGAIEGGDDWDAVNRGAKLHSYAGVGLGAHLRGAIEGVDDWGAVNRGAKLHSYAGVGCRSAFKGRD